MTKRRRENKDPVANGLLAALPRKEHQLLMNQLESVTLMVGQILYEPGKPIRHVYFPCDSLVSLLTPVDGHVALEVGLVGREGMLGIPLVLGINESPVCALVERAGKALRMKTARFRSEHEKYGCFHRELNRYIHQRIVQLTQTAACNRFHPVEARLARWLLMTRDRVETNHFHLTQEVLGNRLGVLRVAITHAAGALQRRKLISYRRGEINILDAKGLEAAACRCYQVFKGVPSHART
jgi:CRP-like cAMP-binding protein